MDGTNSLYPLTVGFAATNTQYLPIPVETKRQISLGWCDRISVGWLGRLSHDKVNTICAMLELCSRYAMRNGLEFDFHIIGEGLACKRLQNISPPGVRRFFVGTLREQALNEYLAANVKIGFAMGTSLLEFAMLGIPALVGDYSNDPYPCEKLPLRWLVPNEDFSLGEIIGERRRQTEVDIAEVVMLCRDETANRAMGRRCRDYAEQNHGTAQIGERLASLLDTTLFSFEKARPIVGGGSRAWGPRFAQLAVLGRSFRNSRSVDCAIPNRHLP